MKTFLQTLRRQDGFTLVELMVVVAIIGLLSAVAVPNFKKYQAKSKTSEAKLHLAAAYTAEQAFFSDYNMYSTCLAYMGYNPAPEAASRYFTTGFNTAATTVTAAHNSAVNSGLNAAGCPQANPSANGNSHFLAGKGTGGYNAAAADLGSTLHGDQSTTGNMTFTMGAAGTVDGAFAATTVNALFHITDAKIITVVRQGY